MNLSNEQIRQFDRDGYLFVEGLFDQEEVELLERITKASEKVAQDSWNDEDAEGGFSRIWLTEELDDDTFSAFARCERIVNPIEQLLRDKVYHFHHKMMLKDP
jgi:hypothetical protein